MFGEAFDDPAGYGSKPTSDEYLRDLLASDQFMAIAAVGDDGVVGGLAPYALRKFEQVRSEIHIHYLVLPT